VAWTSSRSCAFLLVLAGGIGAGARAWAAGAGVAVRVEPESREPCGGGHLFLQEIALQDPNVRAAGPDERAPLLVVRITRTSRGAAYGRLVVKDTDGAVSRREVEGETCESVLAALALMSAVAVDPSAPLPRAGPSSPSSQPAEAGTPSEAETQARARAATSRELVHEKTDADGGQQIAAETTSSQSARVSFAGGVGATTAVAPGLVLLVPTSVDLAWDSPSRVSPMIRVGFEHAGSGDDAAPGGSARFVLNAGTVDACVRVQALRRLDLFPCFRAEGGVLSSTGVDIVPARSDSRPWVAMGALGAVRYRVVWHLFGEILAGIQVPFIRDRYFFEPDTTVFRPPPVALLGSASIGLTIP
jgi:hypothetical protein